MNIYLVHSNPEVWFASGGNEPTKIQSASKENVAGDELRAKRRPEMDTNGFYGDTFSRLVKFQITVHIYN